MRNEVFDAVAAHAAAAVDASWGRCFDIVCGRCGRGTLRGAASRAFSTLVDGKFFAAYAVVGVRTMEDGRQAAGYELEVTTHRGTAYTAGESAEEAPQASPLLSWVRGVAEECGRVAGTFYEHLKNYDYETGGATETRTAPTCTTSRKSSGLSI